MTTQRLFIVVEGGVVTRLFSPDDLGGLEVTTLDLDVGDADRSDLKIMVGDTGEPVIVSVNEDCSIEVDAPGVFLSASLEEFDDLFVGG